MVAVGNGGHLRLIAFVSLRVATRSDRMVVTEPLR